MHPRTAMRAVVALFLVASTWLCAACGLPEDFYAGNLSGYRGTLSVDGRNFGKHDLETKGTFGDIRNGAVGTCGRSDDGKSITFDAPFDSWTRSGHLAVEPSSDAKGVEVDVAWTHVFIPRSDCARFDIALAPSRDPKTVNGSLKLTCHEPGSNGDALTLDAEFQGC